MRALSFAALLLVPAGVGCATPFVEERPGNPDDNICTPCAPEALWRRPGPNPCPCADDAGSDAEADGDDRQETATDVVVP